MDHSKGMTDNVTQSVKDSGGKISVNNMHHCQGTSPFTSAAKNELLPLFQAFYLIYSFPVPLFPVELSCNFCNN